MNAFTEKKTHALVHVRTGAFVATLLIALLVTACAGRQSPHPSDAAQLRPTVEQFHLKMRWSLWEEASAHTTDNYRHQFLGAWEERGEDYKITDLGVRSVVIDDRRAIVEVEQEWYRGDMVVRKERFVETWVFQDSGVGGFWLLDERIEREEFRTRLREEASAHADVLDPEPEE